MFLIRPWGRAPQWCSVAVDVGRCFQYVYACVRVCPRPTAGSFMGHFFLVFDATMHIFIYLFICFGLFPLLSVLYQCGDIW